ncbi:prepilin-type N-terminal cleavage/methylation domain-containing protein [Clostridium tyrobutyricum]|uniref:prepilin-type N-terminal cleavage/methylation domain-containing protein n=1 Tax=Clostridium tyrobutyricum TaxID=1519 RepID=UPI001C393968|nr:prepilin-type N-terminal cleavage/methylation domain-containing protein [Clostridium tyrobutyricum]MBV4448396.1 prepilin-type N-terminal cleavage/methylation domain-containing protein [Clostridium tyrobutyricum]
MEIAQNFKNITKKKKGFTLIELMIVLAIIAILAIVLIPKATIFKNQSKNAGVTTNVNTVRGYLETKVNNNEGSTSYLSAGKLQVSIRSSFGLDANNKPSSTSNEEKLVNPFDKEGKAVKVNDKTSKSIDNASYGSYNVSYKGQVIVDVYSDGYAVYGIDNDGSTTKLLKVK